MSDNVLEYTKPLPYIHDPVEKLLTNTPRRTVIDSKTLVFVGRKNQSYTENACPYLDIF